MSSRDVAVVFAGTPWGSAPMPDHHVARRLAERLDVVYVDPPLSLVSLLRIPETREARRGGVAREVAPGILRVTPWVVPGLTRPGLRVVARRQVARRVAKVLDERNLRAVAAIHAAPLASLGATADARTMLYGTDDWVAGAELMGQDRDWITENENRLLAAADVRVAVSPALATRWESLGYTSALIPNGCDIEHFATARTATPPDDALGLPGPVGVFVGHMSERIDPSLLQAALDHGLSLLIVGPRQVTLDSPALDAVLAHERVRWVGGRDFDELPGYLAAAVVGLVPYRVNDFNKASSPLKTLEYLAAGLPAVSSNLPASATLPGDVVTLTDDAASFGAACAAVAAAGLDDARRQRCVDAASDHGWAARVEEIAALLEVPNRARKEHA